MKEIAGENTVIKVEAPINDPVTIIDVKKESTKHETGKSKLTESTKNSDMLFYIFMFFLILSFPATILFLY